MGTNPVSPCGAELLESSKFTVAGHNSFLCLWSLALILYVASLAVWDIEQGGPSVVRERVWVKHFMAWLDLFPSWNVSTSFLWPCPRLQLVVSVFSFPWRLLSPLGGGRELREGSCLCAFCTFEMKVPAAPLCSTYGSFPGEKQNVQIAFSTELKWILLGSCHKIYAQERKEKSNASKHTWVSWVSLAELGWKVWQESSSRMGAPGQ